MQALRPLHTLTSRSELIEFVKECAPWAEGEASPILGTQEAMDSLIGRLDPAAYGLTAILGQGLSLDFRPSCVMVVLVFFA